MMSSSKTSVGVSSFLRQKVVFTALVILLFVCFLLSLCLGRYSLSPSDVMNSLFLVASGREAEVPAMVLNVVLSVRLPRVLMSILVGASLAAAGAAYQSVFGNPLVSSDVLGVSSGASFGATLGILLASGNTFLTQGLALVFGLVAVLVVMVLGHTQEKTHLYMLVLAGVIVKALFDALVSLIKYVSDPYDKLPAIITWLMGSLSSASYGDVKVVAGVCIPCILVLIGLRWKLNLLSLDEEEAATLGVNVSRLRGAVLLVATFMTATTVSLCGVIGWVGLVIPHMGRMLAGNDYRALIPNSLLMGASYLLLMDDLARTLTTAEIPLSILTAIVGAPIFAYMLRRTGQGSL